MMHPNEYAAVARKANNDRRKEIDKANLKLWTEWHGLRYVHLRRHNGLNSVPAQHGGATIAYTKPKHKGNIIYVSTTIVNPKDVYCRFNGRFNAALNYYNGMRIQVRVPDGTKSISNFLANMFTEMIY
jgi:hypothetical protein